MARSAPELNRAQLLTLFAGLLLAVAPHVGRLPWWVNGAVVLLFGLRVLVAAYYRPLPHRVWLLLFAVGAIVGVLLTYRTVFGRDAGVTLLVLLLSLKLLEMKVLRDIFVVVFLAYFLALTNFFYSQTIPTASLMLLTVLVITASLIGFNDRNAGTRSNFRVAGVLLLQASPVMLLLFFLFPRVPGPLWGLPQDAFAGITGLSDQMTPGMLSSLSQSDAIAFRARFRERPPPRRLLYWRGPVLWDFDGRTWRVGNARFSDNFVIEARDVPVNYEVTLEPHNRNWLFALDLPGQVPPNARPTHDYQLWSLPPVRARMRYEMRSYLSYRAALGGSRRDLALASALPEGGNPRARQLAREWRRNAGEGSAYGSRVLQQAIAFFRNGGYEYTLTPPLLGLNTVDEFLFDTRQGFCEHFASAFVFLMRAASVPARVVTGYQGGEVNPVDGYLEVRQADAHAWAEIWLGDEGWVRVDPTAAAVPIRVESGIAAAVPQSSALPLLMRADIEWLRALRNNWSAMANQWNQWVLGYNFDRQREMLSFFGMRSPDWRTLAALLLWSVGGVIGLTALWLLGRIRRSDPVQQAWLAFCAKLARAGLEKHPGEGPLDYGTRASGELPRRAEAIAAITRLYVDLRYGKDAEPTRAARLRQLVRTFTP
jgi:protein-glutamine gamma-glutamyltransferase